MLIDTENIYKGIESSVLTAGWHHIAAVWDGIDEKIYVDDVMTPKPQLKMEQ